MVYIERYIVIHWNLSIKIRDNTDRRTDRLAIWISLFTI